MNDKIPMSDIEREYNKLLKELINIKINLNDMKEKSNRLDKNKFSASSEELLDMIKEWYIDGFIVHYLDKDSYDSEREIEMWMEKIDIELDKVDNKNSYISKGKIIKLNES